MLRATIQHIANREFVNFDLLLPYAMPFSANDDYNIQFTGSTIQWFPNNSNKAKVTDFLAWLSSWNNFLWVNIRYHEDLNNQLLHYQATITQFAKQYKFSARSSYDTTFLSRLANNPMLRWDILDEEIYNVFIRGAMPVMRCYVFQATRPLFYKLPVPDNY